MLGCSMGEMIMRGCDDGGGRRPLRACNRPLIARLLDSVPPLVKMTRSRVSRAEEFGDSVAGVFEDSAGTAAEFVLAGWV